MILPSIRYNCFRKSSSSFNTSLYLSPVINSSLQLSSVCSQLTFLRCHFKLIVNELKKVNETLKKKEESAEEEKTELQKTIIFCPVSICIQEHFSCLDFFPACCHFTGSFCKCSGIRDGLKIWNFCWVKGKSMFATKSKDITLCWC